MLLFIFAIMQLQTCNNVILIIHVYLGNINTVGVYFFAVCDVYDIQGINNCTTHFFTLLVSCLNLHIMQSNKLHLEHQR